MRPPNRCLRYPWFPLAVCLTLLAVPDRAAARDLGALSQLLAPAYTAMQYAGLCARNPEWSLSEPVGARGRAINYAEHVKDETISALTYDDAVTVLKAAADAARAAARLQLRASVISRDAADESLRFKTWCDGYVTHFIVDFINNHDGDHVAFLEQVDLAKRAGF